MDWTAATDMYQMMFGPKMVCVRIILTASSSLDIWILPSFAGWIRSTSIIWSQVDECNVCAVDWSRLANYEYSIAALVSTKMVAMHIIQFMEFLIRHGMNVHETAIAGHSLGAQVASIVGQYYGGVLDAIYGWC